MSPEWDPDRGLSTSALMSPTVTSLGSLKGDKNCGIFSLSQLFWFLSPGYMLCPPHWWLLFFLLFLFFLSFFHQDHQVSPVGFQPPSLHSLHSLSFTYNRGRVFCFGVTPNIIWGLIQLFTEESHLMMLKGLYGKSKIKPGMVACKAKVRLLSYYSSPKWLFYVFNPS